MRDELAAVLADPSFERSPVSARLLTYLVGETLAGRGTALKSYTVAVEGLGKGSDYEPQVDSYARVTVGRLRKSLDAYYAAAGRTHTRRLAIDSGSYEVKLVANDFNSAPTPGPQQQPPTLWLRSRPNLLVWVIAAAFLALLVAVVISRSGEAEVTHRQLWLNSDFPTVGVELSGRDNGPVGVYDAERMRAMLVGRMTSFPSVRPVTADHRGSDYHVDVYQSTDPDGFRLAISLIDNANHRIIWSETYPIDSEDETEALAARAAFRIANTMGLVNQNELRKGGPTNSPYGCWLRFARKVHTQFSTMDKALNACASDWYAANPNGPLAAGVYGWSLVDQSVYRMTERGRRSDLDEAIRALEQAEQLFPDSGFLLVSTLRAYTFNGDVRSMLLLYPRALAASPGNQDVQGAVGTMLALRGIPNGEALLDAALQDNGNPPSWYHIGKFITAMMREDPAAAGRAVENARRIDRSLSLLPLLDAAVKARTGNLDEARKAWAEALVAVPALNRQQNLLFTRLPISPAVRLKLQQWLKPVMQQEL